MPKDDASPWASNRRIARILLEASHDDPERPVRVRRAFRNFVLVRADLTHYDRDSKDLMRRFGVVGPPTILFLSPEGREIQEARVVGDVGVSGFLSKLAKAIRA